MKYTITACTVITYMTSMTETYHEQSHCIIYLLFLSVSFRISCVIKFVEKEANRHKSMVARHLIKGINP